jgi:hypothetical protein
MFQTLSQIGVHYRTPVGGRGRAVRVGIGYRGSGWAGHDNFAPLTSLEWQVRIRRSDPAWPKPASNFGFRSTASRGSQISEPVSRVRHSVSSGRAATSLWPILADLSGCVGISVNAAAGL